MLLMLSLFLKQKSKSAIFLIICIWHLKKNVIKVEAQFKVNLNTG